MGTFDSGALGNDAALDFVAEFHDVESPAGAIRAALKPLGKKGFIDVDDVYRAWAACELVAIAADDGAGYDPDDESYEAAARLRPTKKLVAQCLAVLPAVLGDASELKALVDETGDRGTAEQLAKTQRHLESALGRSKFPRLKVPRDRAYWASAIPVADRWMIVLEDHTTVYALDIVLDAAPTDLSAVIDADYAVCYACRAWPVEETFGRLGRVRPPRERIADYAYVTDIGVSCLGPEEPGLAVHGRFFINRGRDFEQASYETAKDYPYSPPSVAIEPLVAALTEYVETGTISAARVPTPEERRERYVSECMREWETSLQGEGGSPFSFPVMNRESTGRYYRGWFNRFLQQRWDNEAHCLRQDFWAYELIGFFAASIGVFPKDRMPEALREDALAPDRGITRAHIDLVMARLEAVRHPDRVVTRVLSDTPERLAAFQSEIGALIDGLAAHRETLAE